MSFYSITRQGTAMSLWLVLLSTCSTFSAASCFLASTPSTMPRRAVLSFGMTLPKVDSSSSSSTTTTPTTTASSDDDNVDWWKSVVFQHEDVAKETRPDFPILSTIFADNQHLRYLDSAATSQKPNFVVEALENYYKTQNANVHRGAHSLSRDATAAYEDARDTCTQFISAPSRNEVIFTSGATEAINLVANSYGRAFLQQGDQVVLTVMEHHSNLVPWQMLAQEIGIELKFVGVNKQGELNLEQLEEFLNEEKTKLVSFQHVSNVMGCVNPVKDIVKLVRTKSPDAKILLDACQSIPHLPVNVTDLDIDFMAASGHKACGPTGIGFLWGREDLLNSMPPYMGGGEMIDTVSLSEVTFAQAPARFEAGTPPIAQAIGMAAAFKYLTQIGLDRIEAYEHEMGEYLYKRLNDVQGITILGSREHRAALCAFCHDTVHPSDLSSFLDMEGVAIRAGHHCCQPLHQYLGYSHSARASLYFYNTKEDIDVFIEELQKTLDFFNNLGNEDSSQGNEEGGFVPFI